MRSLCIGVDEQTAWCAVRDLPVRRQIAFNITTNDHLSRVQPHFMAHFPATNSLSPVRIFTVIPLAFNPSVPELLSLLADQGKQYILRDQIGFIRPLVISFTRWQVFLATATTRSP